MTVQIEAEAERAAGAGSVVVGITTHNRAALLRKSIDSALSQVRLPRQVFVVDDASSDGTPLIRQAYPALQWKRNDAVRGYVDSRNYIMLGASEDYFVSLDDDAWFVAGDELGLALAYLEAHPSVAAVAFDILSPDRPDAVGRTGARPVASFIGCGHVLRLSAVRQLNGYLELPGSYGGEEKDLCLRLIDAGYEIVLLQGVHVWHDKSALTRDIPRQHRSGVCNDFTIALLRTPAALLPSALLWKLRGHLIFAVRHRLLGPALSGIGDFLRCAGHVWAARRPVRIATMRRFRELSRSPALRHRSPAAR